MADLEMEVSGFDELLAELDKLERDVQTVTEYTVGTGVSYSVYLENGTSKMDAKPIFRPAINDLRTKGVKTFVRKNTGRGAESASDASELLALIARALENRITDIITNKGLVQTGVLRASVVAVRGRDTDVLPTEADFGSVAPNAELPATDGRRVASETIEI